ncbi:cytochrome P450 [Schizopora paradoxa]|uniref:Cytochrome P450 n=1 Tax=Schizopora paradoxa TaxID=27342 RepID=A0A0H2RQ66_9AGAM|nr:cytochrome P450 [Schizopora paradoxa]
MHISNSARITLSTFAIASTTASIVYYWWSSKRSSKKSPPGPKGLPLFGNEFQIPDDKQWLTFHEWGKTYGDIVRITTMGQPVLILNSAQAAIDLLETRGNIYSDRPVAVMAGELVGWDRGLGYARYGERFKEFRRMFHQIMGSRPSQDLLPMQEKETAELLIRLLDRPEDFIAHARQSTGATILMISYGYKVAPADDPYVRIAEEAMLGFAKASEPGAFLVDRFQFLKYMPSWFPGANFQRVAKAMRSDLERLYDVPFNFVMDEMENGREIPSFTSKFLNEKIHPNDEDRDFVKAAAASLYSGGADTTPSSISSFILAMTLYPDVQAKAQEEVDRVTGCNRLPSFADRVDMPYVNALVKEILRWNPAVPLGLPHQVTQDDTYRGYTIAKGTVIWANIWSILHDEKIYPEPLKFEPERFLNQAGSVDRLFDPSLLAFGFGRRICPGMHLADNSIFITVASILAVFSITKCRDANGEELTPVIDYSGFISHPRPFKCSISPRSDSVTALILNGVQEFEASPAS